LRKRERISMRRFFVMLAPALLAVCGAVTAQTPQPTEAPGAPPQTTQPKEATPPPPAAGVPGAVPTPPAAAGPAAMASPVDAATYIIGAEDGLQVTVWKDPTLSGTFPVRPDGMISLTLIGDIQAAGMTPMQLTANLTEKLKKYIQDPIVSVVVTAVNSKKVFVIGEVGHVGPIMLTPDMTALQAIATAGGLTMFAHPGKIYILRGKQKQIPFDYKKALKGDSKQQIALQPGDTIVVP
jgi:polysaccharide export outer membrane protein